MSIEIDMSLTKEQKESILKLDISSARYGSFEKIVMCYEHDIYQLFKNLGQTLFNDKNSTDLVDDWLRENKKINLLELIDKGLFEECVRDPNRNRLRHFIAESMLEYIGGKLKDKRETNQLSEQLLEKIINGPVLDRSMMTHKVFKCYFDIGLHTKNDDLSANLIENLLKTNDRVLEFVKKEKIKPAITKRFKDYLSDKESKFPYIMGIINNGKNLDIKEDNVFQFREVSSLKAELNFADICEKYSVSERAVDSVVRTLSAYLNNNKDFTKSLNIEKVTLIDRNILDFEYKKEHEIQVKQSVSYMFEFLGKLLTDKINIDSSDKYDALRDSLLITINRNNLEEVLESKNELQTKKIKI